ncbi:MAG: sigma-54 dependent transcriptional regulator [Planctomycetes bacterium]|nr:sigma-54 dependent transcriptional regulator [Planctomycetota bacterium]
MNESRIQILVADDIAANRTLLRQTLEPAGYDILLVPSGEETLKVAQRARPSLILLDVMMPGLSGFETCRQLKEHASTRDIPVIFITAKDDGESMVQGFRVGGVDYITRPFNEGEVLARIENHLRIHQLAEQLQQKNRQLQEEIARREQAEGQLARADDQLSILSQQEAQRWGIEGFVSGSPTISAILHDVRRLQQADKTAVLITGESGTGKELIARAIHFGGSRSRKPFIALNCSTVPRELAESTLFGHVRGAFTGAHESRKGYFELADGGTLFLDEIGDMPQDLQPKLLRVLEDGSFLPVGGTHERHADVRLLSATNQDLQTRIARKEFRQDLYFRLAQFTVAVPPLRDRPEDIPLLADHFLEMFAREMGKRRSPLSAAALAELQRYRFPGNVRELKNIIERALIQSGGGAILPEHLYLLDDPEVLDPPAGLGEMDVPARTLEDFKRRKELVIKRAQNGSSQGQASGGPQPAPTGTEEEKILTHVEAYGSINNAECRQLLCASYDHVSYLLKKLHEYGLLIRQGDGRWARYHLPLSSADMDSGTH